MDGALPSQNLLPYPDTTIACGFAYARQVDDFEIEFFFCLGPLYGLVGGSHDGLYHVLRFEEGIIN